MKIFGENHGSVIRWMLNIAQARINLKFDLPHFCGGILKNQNCMWAIYAAFFGTRANYIDTPCNKQTMEWTGNCMVLILDGNSEISAHVRSNLGYLISLWNLVGRRAVRNRILFLRKDLVSFYIYISISQWKRYRPKHSLYLFSF